MHRELWGFADMEFPKSPTSARPTAKKGLEESLYITLLIVQRHVNTWSTCSEMDCVLQKVLLKP